MPVKVNFVLDDDVKSDLDRLVEAGMRSRIINRALRKELLRIQREALAKKHDELRSRIPALSTREIVRQLRQDRSRG